MNDVSDNQSNPYSTPKSNLDNGLSNGSASRQYAGFWIRTLAAIIDTIIMLIITSPLLYLFYGADFITSESMVKGGADIIISYIFPIAFSVALWMKFGGTPGKRMLGLKVIDEQTGQYLTLGKSLLRYVGYLVSTIGLLIGFFWVAFDKKKKGWHDHIAGSIVVVE